MNKRRGSKKPSSPRYGTTDIEDWVFYDWKRNGMCQNIEFRVWDSNAAKDKLFHVFLRVKPLYPGVYLE
jgi:hypothetical protein